MTRQELAELLSSGVDASGETLTIGKVDILGHKTSAHLLAEVNSTEVYLYRDETTGRIIRFALSGKLLIEDKESGWVFCEIAREYPNGFKVSKIKKHGLSETRRKGEYYRESLMWGILEEMHIFVKPSELEEFIPQIVGNTIVRSEEHESSVYYGIVSKEFIFRYCWDPFARSIFSLLWEMLQPRNWHSFKDYGISLWNRYQFWRSLETGSEIQIKERDGVKIIGKWFPKDSKIPD